jgi:hypothetical protein
MVVADKATFRWLAALVDGEGSIMLNRRTFSGNTKATTTRGRGIQYRPVVVIAANTDYRLMEAIREEIQVGQVYEHVVSNTAKSFNPRKRRQWTYRLNTTQIANWLPGIRPWLVLKKEQADLLLEAQQLKLKLTPGNGTAWRHEQTRKPITDQLDTIYERIRELNTRGREPGN